MWYRFNLWSAQWALVKMSTTTTTTKKKHFEHAVEESFQLIIFSLRMKIKEERVASSGAPSDPHDEQDDDDDDASTADDAYDNS